MAQDAPLVESIHDLRPVTEWFHVEDDGQLKLSRTTFGFVTSDYLTYFGSASVGKRDLTVDVVNGSLKRIPDLDIYPDAPPQVTIATVPPDGHGTLFVKTPKLSRYDELEGTGIAAKLLLQEIESLEVLSLHNHHPNIIKYHGCIVQRGRVVGVVLDRYAETLQERLDGIGLEAMEPSDREQIVSKLGAAVAHIHQTGHAHNDISPSNIMLKDVNSFEPVIIGFGSCRPVGQPLVPAGTPGWVDEKDWSTSAVQNDELALARIQSLLMEYHKLESDEDVEM